MAAFIKKAQVCCLAVLLAAPVLLQAQWVCRSKLAAHLKPVAENIPVLWAVETVAGGGALLDLDQTDRRIFNAITFVGLNATAGDHEVFVNAGAKWWQERHPVTGQTYGNARPGLKEAFYRFSNTRSSLRLGLSNTTFGDHFLVNQRGDNAAWDYTIGPWSLSAQAGSVIKDFARFGTFCSVQYLYSGLPQRTRPFLGEEVGDTDYAGGVLAFYPGRGRIPAAVEPDETGNVEASGEEEFSSDEFSADEFSSDEFSTEEFSGGDEFSADEFSEEAAGQEKARPKEPFIQVRCVAPLVYTQFGNHTDPVQYGGVFGEVLLRPGITVKPEAVYQYAENNQMVIWFTEVRKDLFFDPGISVGLSAAVFNRYDLDPNPQVLLLFTRLFLGEMLRIDIPDLPLYRIAAECNLPGWRLGIKGQYVSRIGFDGMNETDLETNYTLFKHLYLTLIAGRVDAAGMIAPVFMGRGEVRLAF